MMSENQEKILQEIEAFARSEPLAHSARITLCKEVELFRNGKSPTTNGVLRELKLLGTKFPVVNALLSRLADAGKSERTEAAGSPVLNVVAYLDVATLSPHPSVKDLFPIDKETFRGISRNMKEKGFNEANPLLVVPSEESGRYFVYDGLTRLEAARENGIGKVPVRVNHFDCEESLLSEAVRIQSLRRNNSDAVVMRCVMLQEKEETRKAKDRQGERKDLAATLEQRCPNVAQGRVAEIIACKIGKGRTTVAHTLAILKDAVLTDKVLAGTLSINAAYKQLQKNGGNSGPTHKPVSFSWNAAPFNPDEEITLKTGTLMMLLDGISDMYLEKTRTEMEPDLLSNLVDFRLNNSAVKPAA